MGATTAAAANAPLQVSGSQAAPLTLAQVETTVDTFLYNLYAQLDSAHQKYENTLRGLPANTDPSQEADLAQSAQELIQNVEFGTQGTGFGNVSPPFGPGGPGQTGNPLAIAQQGSSALNNLSQSWQNFGASVQNNAQRAQLTQQISGYQSQISSLQTQIASLSQPGVYTLDQQQTLKNLQNQLNQVTQQLANAQTQLAQLPSATTP